MSINLLLFVKEAEELKTMRLMWIGVEVGKKHLEGIQMRVVLWDWRLFPWLIILFYSTEKKNDSAWFLIATSQGINVNMDINVGVEDLWELAVSSWICIDTA